MSFDLQPRLHDELIRLEPLKPEDFEALYAVASDPLIWEQHPNKDRFQRAVFENFFAGALASGGALRVLDNTGQLIGSSRFYDLDERNRVVAIGYTFIARSHWGGRFNRQLKKLMLDHAFRFVDRVVFHVGADNARSRKAMEKLGAVLVGEGPVAYHGEQPTPNVIYEIEKKAWA